MDKTRNGNNIIDISACHSSSILLEKYCILNTSVCRIIIMDPIIVINDGSACCSRCRRCRRCCRIIIIIISSSSSSSSDSCSMYSIIYNVDTLSRHSSSVV